MEAVLPGVPHCFVFSGCTDNPDQNLTEQIMNQNPVENSLAIVFPGQGSQSVGMLAALAETSPEVRRTFEEASAILGYDLWKLVQEGPGEELNKTEKTQPAMLAAGTAVWRAWTDAEGPRPFCMAGHSLGEYTALVCAGSLKLTAAVELVQERGRCMQSAVPDGSGAMAAILGLEDDAVRDICAVAAEDEVVSAVNFNSPGQVVIAGHTGAVERAILFAREKGAKRAIKLPVSVPSHCALMKPAAEAFGQLLNETEIGKPDIPVIHNVDVTRQDEPSGIRARLQQQLYQPVRWVETIQHLAGQGINTVLEAGPGKVLNGLTRRIDKSLTGLPVYDPDSLASALASCRRDS